LFCLSSTRQFLDLQKKDCILLCWKLVLVNHIFLDHLF